MKPLVIYYHIYLTGAYKTIVQDQITKVMVSGLYDACEKMVISVAGGGQADREWIAQIPNNYRKMSLVFHEGKAAEGQTLRLLSSEAKKQDAYFLYFHTKGVSNSSYNADTWRAMLDYYSIHQWRSRVGNLNNNYDATGIHWHNGSGFPGGHYHFSGNYWWARSEHINRLDDTYLDEKAHVFGRFGVEFWIGSAPGAIYCPHNQEFVVPYLHEHNITSYIMDTSTHIFNIPESQELISMLIANNTHGFETPGGTDKATQHAYTGAYEMLLAPYRDKPINMLEVGVQWGGSSLLWHCYLPQAKLALADIVDIVHPSIFERMDPSRYHFYVADAYDDQTVQQIAQDHPEGFDVAIDDGPHTLESQILFIQKYLPHMKKGGVMIVEDIQNPKDLNELERIVPDEYKSGVRVIDLRELKGRYDDLMFILHI